MRGILSRRALLYRTPIDDPATVLGDVLSPAGDCVRAALAYPGSPRSQSRITLSVTLAFGDEGHAAT